MSVTSVLLHLFAHRQGAFEGGLIRRDGKMRTVLAVAAAVLACVQPGEAFGVGPLMVRAGFRSAPVMAPLSLRRGEVSEVVPMQEPVRRCAAWRQSGLTTRCVQGVDMIAFVVRRVCCRRRAI